jgi:flagellar biosynthesis protein FliR
MSTHEIPFGGLVYFVLTLGRVGGMLSFAPFFGGGVVALKLRILLTLMLSWVLFPLVGDSVEAVPAEILPFALLLAREVLIGILFGLVARLVLASLEVAGYLIGFQMGFASMQLFDPQSQTQIPFMAVFLNLTGMMVFLSIGAHHWLIQTVADSYRIAPYGSAGGGPVVRQLIQSSSGIFVLGLKLAAPIVVVLVVITVLLGIVGRAAPQIHILIVGLPAQVLIGFILLTATVNTLIPVMGHHFAAIRSELTTYQALIRR